MQSHATQSGSSVQRHFEAIEYSLGTRSVIADRQDIATGCKGFFSSLDDTAYGRRSRHGQVIGEHDATKIEIASK